eukprot:Lithocolla_globosa_v1_NODE_1442_length_2572_cov_7.306714.p1 type:complete len:142 gc:universal NODE_1442_length_2572_cov_7.306714:568-143(-)
MEKRCILLLQTPAKPSFCLNIFLVSSLSWMTTTNMQTSRKVQSKSRFYERGAIFLLYSYSYSYTPPTTPGRLLYFLLFSSPLLLSSPLFFSSPFPLFFMDDNQKTCKLHIKFTQNSVHVKVLRKGCNFFTRLLLYYSHTFH